MKIQSMDKDMRVLLSSHFYKIPAFQRPYSWEEEEIQEFWDDVVKGNNNYFIGSMVVFSEPNKSVFNVVDGQQRLTTITIMLCAIRNSLRDAGFTSFSEALQQFIERWDVNAKYQFVLQTESSYPYFQEYIQKSTPPEIIKKPSEEESNLDACFTQIKDNIDKIIDDIRKEHSPEENEIKELIRQRLFEIRDKILNLKVIFIDLDSEDDAFIAFETLNARGRELEVTDLVKSHLFRLLKPNNANVNIPKGKWSDILKNVEESERSMSDFLHDCWVAQYGNSSFKRLFKSIKGEINDRDSASKFLDDLLETSQIYRDLFDQNKWDKSETDIKISLQALKIFKVSQHLPILIAIMKKYKSGTIKKRTVTNILRKLESFHFVFTAVVSERANKASKEFFAKHARKLMTAKDHNELDKYIKAFESDLKSKLPSFEDFELNFLKIRYTSKYTKQKPLVQYILAEIDRANRKESGTVLDYSQMTIEHLSPEKPVVGEPLSNIGQIGNLILAERKFNSNQLANKDFTEKRELLATSNIFLDEKIVNASKWDNKEIEARTKYLADIGYNKIWNL